MTFIYHSDCKDIRKELFVKNLALCDSAVFRCDMFLSHSINNNYLLRNRSSVSLASIIHASLDSVQHNHDNYINIVLRFYYIADHEKIIHHPDNVFQSILSLATPSGSSSLCLCPPRTFISSEASIFLTSPQSGDDINKFSLFNLLPF